MYINHLVYRFISVKNHHLDNLKHFLKTDYNICKYSYLIDNPFE